ncbi:MAG: hypothetical protein KF698_08315 [Anaerolineales bacterium]|nr:hypothetical protein [Anaerolineales bacterium]
MANSIALAEKFLPILDEIYKRASLTAALDALTKPVDFGGANEVKIFKTSMVGLGNYGRNTGYPVGDVTGTWETIQLTKERGREFNIDRMDNEETLGMAFGTLVGEFMRTQVVPEVDATRFAAWADGAGLEVDTPAVLNANTVLQAIDAANAEMDAAEVPQDGRLLYVSDSVWSLLKSAVTRSLANETTADRRIFTLDGIPVRMVPQTRFKTEITLNAGSSSSAGGFAPAVGAQDINFLLLHPTARDQATKLALPKVFDPDTNQDMDAWKFQFRLYHDTWVYENKAEGIYLHMKPGESA